MNNAQNHPKPPLTTAAVEGALERLLPRLPFWALRQGQHRIGTARDPLGCPLRACLQALLQGEFDCGNLLGVYQEEIWIQGERRPLKITLPAWATALVHGLDDGKAPGSPIIGTDVFAQLEQQGFLVAHDGYLWGQGALATATLQEDGDPGQDRVYRPGGYQGAFAMSWTITTVSKPDERR